MSLIIKNLFKVLCPICSWYKTYDSFNEIPVSIKAGICPSCGGTGAKTWKKISNKE